MSKSKNDQKNQKQFFTTETPSYPEKVFVHVHYAQNLKVQIVNRPHQNDRKIHIEININIILI